MPHLTQDTPPHLPSRAPQPTEHEVNDILAKARTLSGLTEDEVARLLAVSDSDQLAHVFAAARDVKDLIYGKRLVLFAPLYVSNLCVNNCRYCAFKASNQRIQRRRLSQADVSAEVETLLADGHKRLLLVAGESPSQRDFDYLLETIETIYSVGGERRIRRLNVNVAPLSDTQFKILGEREIGTYQIFQETYHRPTYEHMHPSGPKADYDHRLSTPARAMAAGIGDIGIGVLFGLHDYRFEVAALIRHAASLEARFGVGPHTISVPRLEPAAGSREATHPPHAVSDRDFLKIIAVLRLAVPYTGIILSTRETETIRREALHLGVSQISAGSRTNPGGYCDRDGQAATAQFQLGDHRSLDAVIRDVLDMGYLPSFCTGCYRKGRTGKDFMDLAKPGLIKRYCLPNGLLTLAEYLLDHASPETRRMGEQLIATHLEAVPTAGLRTETANRLSQIKRGKRDLYF